MTDNEQQFDGFFVAGFFESEAYPGSFGAA